MFWDANTPKLYVSFGRTSRVRLFFAMGKIQGTPDMRSHISVHPVTTKYFSNSCVFKTRLKRKDFPEVARLAWAQEVPSSNLGAPTNLFCDLQASLKSPSPHYGGNSGDPIATSPSFPLLAVLAASSPLLPASSRIDTSLALLPLPPCNAPRFSRTAWSSRFPSVRGSSAKS